MAVVGVYGLVYLAERRIKLLCLCEHKDLKAWVTMPY